VLLPTSALQMAVSRDVSQSLALGRADEATSFARAVLALGLKATVALLVIAFALLVPLRDLLNIHSTSAVALTLVALSTALARPIALGVVQGYERFRRLAWLTFSPFGIRLGVLIVLAILGMRLYGALAAVTVSAVAAAILALAAIRSPLRSATGIPAARLRPF